MDAIRQGVAFLTEDRKRTGLCLELPCFWNVTLPNLDVLGMEYFRLQPSREATEAARVGGQMNVKWASPQAPANSLSGGTSKNFWSRAGCWRVRDS